MLFIGQDLTAYQSELTGVIVKGLTIGITICLLALIAIGIVIHFINDGIKKTVIQLNRLSTKDFSTPIDPKLLARHDEIGMLSNSMKIMQANIVDILSEVSHLSYTVKESAKALTTNSHHMAIHSEKVVASSQEITCSTTTQAEDLINIDQAVGTLSDSLDAVTHSMTKDRKSVV